MKKFINKKKSKLNIHSLVIIYLILIFVFALLYFLQTNLFPLISLNGVVPNLSVIFILFIGLFGNNLLAVSLGLLFGLFIDLIHGEVIGITPAMLCLVGFIATWFDSLWSKDEKISIIIMIILSTFIFELGAFFIKSIVLKFELEIGIFFKILFWEEIYNVLLTTIFFSLIKKLGYIMERKLKRNNMYSVEL